MFTAHSCQSRSLIKDSPGISIKKIKWSKIKACIEAIGEPMHLVIYFAGTGEEIDPWHHFSFDYISNNSKVSMLFVEGCHHKEVCNNGLTPNLSNFAKRFMKAFEVIETEPNKGKLKLIGDANALKALGIGIATIPTNQNSEDLLSSIESFSTVQKDFIIDDITLTGFSRGGVTCFEVAKELQALQRPKQMMKKLKDNEVAPPLTPVSIIAAEPVPGNFYQGPFTNAGSIADCSHLENLERTSIILGAYTSKEVPAKGIMKPLKQLFHKGFFSQIVPKLPYKTRTDLIITPRESHFDFRKNIANSLDQLHLQLAKFSFDKGLISKKTLNEKEDTVKEGYQDSADEPIVSFPHNPNKYDRIFGLPKNKFSKHFDPLHQEGRLKWNSKEEDLMDWWTRQDEKVSRLSSQLTKDLVQVIPKKDDKTNNYNQKDMENLFKTADQWLLKKADTSSSRYFQVQCLRNNTRDYLKKIDPGVDVKLSDIHRQNLAETSYLHKHWFLTSTILFHKRTDDTRRLDQAFFNFAKSPPTIGKYDSLLTALETWRNTKEGQNSDSKRMDIVIDMINQVKDVIASYPEKEKAMLFQAKASIYRPENNATTARIRPL